MVITPERTQAGPEAGVAGIIADLLGTDLPVRIDCYDGTTVGPPDASTRLVVRSEDALRYILTAPGELGFARAYVAGALEIDGNIFDALELRDQLPDVHLGGRQFLAFARLVGTSGFHRPPIPPEEARLTGHRHTRERDAAAISFHYDVSNDFYRMVLGPSMTYSCAVWKSRDTTLEAAQAEKYDLVCRKLALRPGMRLLDVGCGWGGMVQHAARHYGVKAVGVTLSAAQAEAATRTTESEGLADSVEIRIQDYRDVDGSYDAISSIGMFEHVGLARLGEYFRSLHRLLVPGGRVLNHGISSPPGRRARFRRRGFIDRYVFPDGELHEIGSVVSRMQAAGFEVRHVESLREHYALTLREWVTNLEHHWDDAVAAAGLARARIWRLYMAGSAVNFEAGNIQIHQTLGVRADGGRSGMPLRPDW
jgi:cyclopropane-fatty-acyl-phospholipid synthase